MILFKFLGALLILQIATAAGAAAETVAEAKARYARYTAETKRLQSELNDASKAYSALSARAEALRDERSGLVPGARSGIESLFTGNELTAAELETKAKRMREIDDELSRLNRTVSMSGRDVRKLREEVYGRLNSERVEQRNIAEREQASREREQDFSSALQAAELETKLADLGVTSNSIATTLAKVEARFDKTVMALYMRAKLEDLLKSPQFCSAQKSCPPAGGAPSQNVNLDSLFKPSSATTPNKGNAKPATVR